MAEKVEEGNVTTETPAEETTPKPHPETVPWNQYVGLKEKFNKSETRWNEEKTSLEEQLKNAPDKGTAEALKKELDELKVAHEQIKAELAGFKEKSISEKRATLVAKGVSEEKVKGLSEKELDLLNETIGSINVPDKKKPAPDFGSGGGAAVLTGSPMDLARQAYSKK